MTCITLLISASIFQTTFPDFHPLLNRQTPRPPPPPSSWRSTHDQEGPPHHLPLASPHGSPQWFTRQRALSTSLEPPKKRQKRMRRSQPIEFVLKCLPRTEFGLDRSIYTPGGFPRKIPSKVRSHLRLPPEILACSKIFPSPSPSPFSRVGFLAALLIPLALLPTLFLPTLLLLFALAFGPGR
jgi:hypothetical protein